MRGPGPSSKLPSTPTSTTRSSTLCSIHPGAPSISPAWRLPMVKRTSPPDTASPLPRSTSRPTSSSPGGSSRSMGPSAGATSPWSPTP